jgi:hypothetical protein
MWTASSLGSVVVGGDVHRHPGVGPGVLYSVGEFDRGNRRARKIALDLGIVEAEQ